nr:MAG TPA: hypothetical protein [Caudoviricetes sp.]
MRANKLSSLLSLNTMRTSREIYSSYYGEKYTKI